jgi:hypothetical protein
VATPNHWTGAVVAGTPAAAALDDASTFSKYFQQRTATTPAAFRDRVNGHDVTRTTGSQR